MLPFFIIFPLEVLMLEREVVGGTFEVGIGAAGFESEAAGTNTDSSSFRPNVSFAPVAPCLAA
jgi:hypothetical protein